MKNTPGRSLRFWLLGSSVALVLTSAALPAVIILRSFAEPPGELAAPVLAAALAVALVAALAALLLGRRLVEPLEALREAALRLGRGDLLTPIPPLPGRELGALAATLDEARRRLHEQAVALGGREEEARALLLGMVEGVIAVDSERRLTYLNPQAARLLGVDAAAALGRFCGDVLQPRSEDGGRPCRDACPIVLARSLGQARAVESLEAGGRRSAMVLRASRPAGGRQVMLLRDETAQEAGQRARDAFLANVSHELKTPVAGQLASLELLLDLELAPPAGELVGSLQRSTLRLQRLIDNVLESVRLELAPGQAADHEVDLDAMLAEAVDFVAPLLRQREQRLEQRWRRPLPAIRGEQASLCRVFVNLLANAHHAAPAGSRLELGAAAEAGRLRLWVEDEGPGVDPEVAATLFDRFRRAPATGGRGGLGLGLWIARAIVVRHGGELAVGPGAAGVGSRFTVILPLPPGEIS